MLLTVSPSAASATDTLHSVTYASRLRGLELGHDNAAARTVHPATASSPNAAQSPPARRAATAAEGASGEKGSQEECARLRKLVADLQVRTVGLTI